ncbi:MAG: hypothetical protein R3F46_04025 [bacterium]
MTRGKGVKILAIVDRQVAVVSDTHAANHHEVSCGATRLISHAGPAKHLIGDKAYDSDDLDENWQEMASTVAPHRCNQETGDAGRSTPSPLQAPLARVERFFAWLQWQRRLLERWELHSENFLGLVQLAVVCIFLKQF